MSSVIIVKYVFDRHFLFLSREVNCLHCLSTAVLVFVWTPLAASLYLKFPPSVWSSTVVSSLMYYVCLELFVTSALRLFVCFVTFG